MSNSAKPLYGELPKTQCLNFVLIGEVRAGTYPLHTALAATPSIAAHAHLLHNNVQTRTKAYTSYFKSHGVPFNPDDSSAHHFLKNRIFDRPLHAETIIGVRITYDQMLKHDLFDFLKEQTNEGDFCVIHVERNPLACFVSKKQAEASLSYYQTSRGTSGKVPNKIWLDGEDLTDFTRDHSRVRDKVNAICHDVCRIQYQNLYFNFDAVMTTVLSFLEIPETPIHQPTAHRLPNNTMAERVFQLDKILAELPDDVRGDIMARDLF